VLAFLKGLVGGGGSGEAPPVAPEPGGEDGSPKPWEVDLGSGPREVGGVDTGSAAPAVEEPPTQDDTASLIEALMQRNEEFAPYRDTGLGVEPKRPLRP
jgi:hypothetical protein